jgi:hypothetical protein
MFRRARLPTGGKVAIIAGALGVALALSLAAITTYRDARASRDISAPPIEIRHLRITPPPSLDSRSYAAPQISAFVDRRVVSIVPRNCWSYGREAGLDRPPINPYEADRLGLTVEFVIVSSVRVMLVRGVTLVVDAYSPPVDPTAIGEATILADDELADRGSERLHTLGSIAVRSSFRRETIRQQGDDRWLDPRLPYGFNLLLVDPGRYQFHLELETLVPNLGLVTVRSETLSYEWLYMEDLSSVRSYTRETWPEFQSVAMRRWEIFASLLASNTLRIDPPMPQTFRVYVERCDGVDESSTRRLASPGPRTRSSNERALPTGGRPHAPPTVT